MPAEARDTLTLLATRGWKDYVDALARHARLNRSQLIDQAVAGLAKSYGFPDPPPPRLAERRRTPA